jgi:transcriptional regulator with XRE-family HTH domain
VDVETMSPTAFAGAAGEVLRRVREGRSLSLRQVTVRSGGRFKPSSVASYERGERQISLERLFALARVYDIAPERVVAAIAHRIDRDGRDEADPDLSVVLDPQTAGSGPR